MNRTFSTIAVTGAHGQLGSELCRQLGEVAVGLSRAECDLASPSDAARAIERLKADILIHAAAYTQVDRAESEPELCRRVNVEAVERLVEVCRRRRMPLVLVSTDYVFAAAPPPGRPFREDDRAAPAGVYAATKRAAECCVAALEDHLIVRTCGLYGHPLRPRGGPNFVDTMLRRGAAGLPLRVVDDQRCTPSFTADVTRGLLHLVRQGQRGLFHLTNGGETTWYEFAREIFRCEGIATDLSPISTAEYGAVAPRPAYSVLDTAKYASSGGPAIRDWRQALAEYLGGGWPSAAC